MPVGPEAQVYYTGDIAAMQWMFMPVAVTVGIDGFVCASQPTSDDYNDCWVGVHEAATWMSSAEATDGLGFELIPMEVLPDKLGPCDVQHEGDQHRGQGHEAAFDSESFDAAFPPLTKSAREKKPKLRPFSQSTGESEATQGKPGPSVKSCKSKIPQAHAKNKPSGCMPATGNSANNNETSSWHGRPADMLEGWLQQGMAMDPLKVVDNTEACTKFVAVLSSKENGWEVVMSWVCEHAVALALAPGGCRFVQRLLEILGGLERDRLVARLLPFTVELFESPHGNHVLTKVIEVVPRPALMPIVRYVEFKGCVIVARHCFGSRVLERLIEHGDEEHMASMVDELVNHSEELSRHPYGNFVIQHFLEHGSFSRRAMVLQRLLPFLPYLATHRTACHVVQKALSHSSAQGRQAIAVALLQALPPYSLPNVAASRYGSYCIEELRNAFGPEGAGKEAETMLKEAFPEHSESSHFLRVAGSYGLLKGESEIVPGQQRLGKVE